MAYGTIYTANWRATGKTGVVTIAQKDYVGTSSVLKLQNDAITITKQLDNWESHIIGDVCEFNIINDKADYYELLDLMVAAERKYKITVTCTYNSATYTLFVGFINTEAVNQKMLRYNVIHLVASSFVSKLEHVYPLSLDTIVNVSFIDIFHEILAQAGSVFPIRVCSFLISAGSIFADTKTFMNQNGVYNEIFWENNIDRVDSRTIMEDILTAFQCYMYFWNGYWYIESFDVLFNNTKYYVEYVAGTSYMPTNSGTKIVVTEADDNDLHALVMLEMSQTLTVTPGNRTVDIRINNQAFYNLTVNEFTSVTKVSDISIPAIRKWQAHQPNSQTLMVWDGQVVYNNMVNSIKRTSTFQNQQPNPTNPERYLTAGYLWRGISTSVLVTHKEGTQLSIKWKYSRGNLRNIPEPAIAGTGYELDLGELSHYNSNWKFRNIAFDFYFYIMVSINGVLKGTIYYDEDDAVWYYNFPIIGGGSVATDFFVGTKKTIEEADFDKNTFICDVSFDISLNEVISISNAATPLAYGDYTFSLFICTERERWYKDSAPFMAVKKYERIVKECWYGDVVITATLGDAEDVVEGKTNTDFIEKKSIELNLADVPDFNYKNGVLEGDSLEFLTSSWRRNEPVGTDRKLVDYILIDKFRTGDISRQRISARIKNTTLLKPFTMFIDSKQNDKKFLLTNIVHDVTKDEYEINLEEYDNETEINLIEEA